jgi:hypothetical protein
MKRLRSWLLPSLTIVAFLLPGMAAKADPLPLSINLDSPFQMGVGDQTLTFDVNLINTGTSLVFLNGDGFNLTSPLTLDDSGFWNNSPFFLAASGASGDFELFTVFIPAVTPQGLYTGTFEILGGGDGNAQEVLGDATFDIEVTPEPSSLLLLGTGLLALGILMARKYLKIQPNIRLFSL